MIENLIQYVVTGRNILESEGHSEFTGNTLLGHVWATDEADAENKAEVEWPGWDWYSAWPARDKAALAA